MPVVVTWEISSLCVVHNFRYIPSEATHRLRRSGSYDDCDRVCGSSACLPSSSRQFFGVHCSSSLHESFWLTTLPQLAVHLSPVLVVEQEASARAVGAAPASVFEYVAPAPAVHAAPAPCVKHLPPDDLSDCRTPTLKHARSL